MLSLALSACLAAPEEASDDTSEAATEAEATAATFFTISPNGPNSGTRYRGSERGPGGPAICRGDIPIQRIFRFDPESGRYVEVTFFACVSDLRGGLRPNGLAFDFYIL